MQQSDLFFAVKANGLELLRKCIASGIDVNVLESEDNNAWTPLMYAVYPFNQDRSNLDIVRELVISGADINMTCRYGMSALRIACSTGLYRSNYNAVDIVKTLLENSIHPCNDIAPLVEASYNCQRVIVKMLFEHMFAEALAKVIDRDLLMVICEFI
jgi:ankyrin repeat protein